MYLLFFLLAEELGNSQNRMKNKKNQKGNFEKGERLDNDGRNSKDFEKTSNSIKSPDEAVNAANNMEKIIRSKKSNILWLAYQQGQIFEKFKVNENFIDMVKKLGISTSRTLFKIVIAKFVNKYPKMKKSSLSLHFS